MAEGCLGIVLRTAPVREADLVVTLYTDVHGRVSAIARGARSSRRRFAGTLSLLVLGRYELARRRGELWELSGAEIVREWTRLASDHVAVAHASYVAELVGALLPPEAPDPEALEIVVALWDSLAEGGPSAAALRACELALLELAGHRPALEQCAVCGEPELDVGGVFDPARGGAICRRCAATSRGPGVRPLARQARHYLLAIAARDNISAARAVDAGFEAVDRLAAREALVAMVTGLVGRPLRSLEYLAKLAGSRRAGS
jgi:DNA repair protein RecO (recombination protein O)